MITNQAYLFLIFALNGVLIGIIFDFFRILRRSFKTADVVTYIEDILFWILTGIVVLYSIFVFNNGQIRFFMFVGILLGLILYMLLISSYIIKINVFIITSIKKAVVTVFKIIISPIKQILKFIKKIFFKPICFLFINVKKITNKKINFFKDMTKKYKNTIKNSKIAKNNVKKEGILK